MTGSPDAKDDSVLSGSLCNRKSRVCAADARAVGLLCRPPHTCTHKAVSHFAFCNLAAATAIVSAAATTSAAATAAAATAAAAAAALARHPSVYLYLTVCV